MLLCCRPKDLLSSNKRVQKRFCGMGRTKRPLMEVRHPGANEPRGVIAMLQQRSSFGIHVRASLV